MTPGIDFHVVNDRGVTLYTSPHRDFAKREAASRAARGEDVWVDEVTVTVSRRRVYRPRQAKAEACAA